jgi:3-deoxy-D-manno-octulosonic-acid transferase
VAYHPFCIFQTFTYNSIAYSTLLSFYTDFKDDQAHKHLKNDFFMFFLSLIKRYQLLLWLLSPVVFAWLFKEAWQHKSWSLLRARLGESAAIKADHWFHCASVGEVNAIAPLVHAMEQQGKSLLVTTFTPTGLEQAQRRFGQLHHIQLRLLPLDWGWTMQRFLASLDCPNLTLVETEFWPNLIQLAHQQGLTIRLINARITHKTLSAPHWWRQLLVELLSQQVSQILCRNDQDERDFHQLGINGEHIQVIGNLKWCDKAPDNLPQLLKRPYVLLASSHDPEELELAKRWQAYNKLPTLVIVPRHPKRALDIVKQFTQADIPFSQRSQNSEHTQGILLADTFGELTAWMAYAELVVMGGSFAPKGGQNPLEAIRLAKLVLSGPDMRDFAEEVNQLVPLGTLIQVNQFDDLMAQIQHYLAHKELRDAGALAGQDWLAQHQQHILANALSALEQPRAVS